MGNHNNALTSLTIFLAFATVAAHFIVVKACISDIYVKTGNVTSAGTDAVITVKLYDAHGRVFEVKDLQKYGTSTLENYDYFERDQLDSFRIAHTCKTYKICKLELSHDNSGGYPGWYVDYLRVRTTFVLGLIVFEDTTFEINQWLDTEDNSLTIQKNLCGSYH